MTLKIEVLLDDAYPALEHYPSYIGTPMDALRYDLSNEDAVVFILDSYAEDFQPVDVDEDLRHLKVMEDTINGLAGISIGEAQATLRRVLGHLQRRLGP